MQIPILFSDSNLVIVSKPNNILVHPSYYARNIKTTPLNEVLFEQLGEKLYPAHRLDHKTSGVIIFGKSSESVAEIRKQFEANTVIKEYYALVRGYTEMEGIIDTPVKNNDTGKYRDALTAYQTLSSVEVDIPVQPYPKSRYSLVKLVPKTGRMHQLRKHMNKISHPIIGDHRYGNRHHNRMFEEQLNLPNLFLHARSIEFNDLKTNQPIRISAPFPDFWTDAMNKLGVDQSVLR